MSAPASPSRRARTNHYLQRCRERQIPFEAEVIVRRYGLAQRKDNGSKVYRIDRLSAWRYAQRGLDLWDFTDVAVVIAADGAVLTAYRLGGG